MKETPTTDNSKDTTTYNAVEKQTRPTLMRRLKSITNIMETVITAHSQPIDENYVFKCPVREVLHSESPPHVQAVSKACDEKGVTLAADTAELLREQHRLHKIIHNHRYNFFQRDDARRKDVAMEARLTQAFAGEEKTTIAGLVNKKTITTDDLEQARVQRAYDNAGATVHRWNGGIKAATARDLLALVEDDLGMGTRLHHR